MEYINGLIKFFSKEKTESCKCKKVKKDYCENIAELLAMSKKNKSFNNYQAKILYEGLLNVDSKILNIEEENNKQILKDLSRTYPSCTLFKDDKIKNKMQNILKAFSNYDREIRYVQGMNFIVGFFLYHCEEHVAFWLFVSLIEEYELRDIYLEGLPGLTKHSKTLKKILHRSFPNIINYFDTMNINLEICMVEWVFSLFSSLIPIDIQYNFYYGFFAEGWDFFYKMCISVISTTLRYEKNFPDPEDIYIALKLGKHNDNPSQYTKIWKEVIDNAYRIEIDFRNLR